MESAPVWGCGRPCGPAPALQGGYRACSRLGIDSNASPFLKITFETATAFLTEAVLRGSGDDLSSPAAALVMGRVVRGGTGGMNVLLSVEP